MAYRENYGLLTMVFANNKISYWLKQFTNSSHIAVLVVDKDRNNLYVNNRLCEMFGYDEKDLLGTTAEVLHVNHESYINFAKLAFDFVLKGEPVSLEYQFKKKDGSVFWLQISGDIVEGQSEVLWIMVDITPRKNIQKELEDTNYNMAKYLEVIDKIEIGLFVVDADFTIRYMNDTMIKWFGNQKNKICYSAVAGLDEPCPYCKLDEVIRENKKVIYEPTTPDGRSFDIVATSIKNADGTVSKMEVIRDITEKKRAEKNLLEQTQKLDHQAHHDFLTGLPNRILFNDRLERGIQESKRNNTKLALLFIDLDHFKEINDSLGHSVGDEVLKEVTTRLKNLIRSSDTIARLGGDEFTIIVSNLNEVQDASVLARKVLEALTRPITLNDTDLYVSCSIGISLYPNDGNNSQNLLKYADAAMYKAKEEGRNNFQFYSSEMTEMAFERVVMEASFRASLKNEDFLVYFQPQVNGRTNKIVGMEALVRWNHPLMGIIPPSRFISLAESTGLIVDLDRYVMKTAMKQVAKWYEDGLNPGVLAMNLTVKQLKEKDFMEFLKGLMIETSCRADWIELEVTEGQIMSNPEESIKVLNKISFLGIELAVDDFGTGYSSLAYLKRLPINKLKIDQAFVRDLPNDEEDVAIAKAVIALASSLNLHIIAEGVEKKEQKDFLVQNGCENIQGYYYSKPIPANELEEILTNGGIFKI